MDDDGDYDGRWRDLTLQRSAMKASAEVDHILAREFVNHIAEE
jgi:hypothetical protein